jgi:preprotein translocase subunit SecY
VLLALAQAYGIAVGLHGRANGRRRRDPGMFFRDLHRHHAVGGTMFLMWLGEQITARGVGNGISLIIFAGIVAELPDYPCRPGTRTARSTSLILAIIAIADDAGPSSSSSWSARSAAC